jgi:hypothetical protein
VDQFGLDAPSLSAQASLISVSESGSVSGLRSRSLVIFFRSSNGTSASSLS